MPIGSHELKALDPNVVRRLALILCFALLPVAGKAGHPIPVKIDSETYRFDTPMLDFTGTTVLGLPGGGGTGTGTVTSITGDDGTTTGLTLTVGGTAQVPILTLGGTLNAANLNQTGLTIAQSHLNLNGVIPPGWLGTGSTVAAPGNDSRITGAAQKSANLSDLSNLGTARTNLGLAIGSNVQAWDADLDLLAAVVTQPFGRGALAQSDASNFRSYINTRIGTDVQAWNQHLDDLVANWDQYTFNLTDPGADRIYFFDHSKGTAGGPEWLTIGGPMTINGTSLEFATPAVRGISKDVYIAVRTDGRDGTGTAEDPYDGSTTALFDAIMASSAKTPANANIYLCGSATFQSKGFAPRSGWKFHAGTATIQIPVLTSGEASAFIAVFGGTSAPLVSDILIEGGIWDLNVQNQTSPVCPAAIQLICDGLVVQNLKVINFGNTKVNEEFVLGNFSNGSRDGIIHRKPVRWRNIEFTSLASGVTNLGTISLINANGGQNVTTNASLSNGWFEDVEVSGIHAHDIAFTDAVAFDVVNIGGWVKNFHGHHNTFKNITGLSQRYGYYLDTGSAQNVSIHDDIISVVSRGLVIRPLTVGSVVDNVNIHHEVINGGSDIPIELDGTTTTVRTVNIDDNQLTIRAGTNIYAHGLSNVKIRRNTIDSSSSEIVTTGSTVVERHDNCRVDGTPVTGDTTLAGTASANTFTGANIFTGYNIFRAAKRTDELFGYQVNVADTSAYNASPDAGIRFEVKVDSTTGTAGIGSLHAYKANATDGDLSGRVGIGTGWNGHNFTKDHITVFEDGGVAITDGPAATTPGVLALQVAGIIKAGSVPTILTDSAGKILSAALNTVGVAQGGTGDTTLTAYAPLFGGTTSTGPVQSGTVGTAGQVLTSNGAGALPTFQAAAGGSDNLGLTPTAVKTANYTAVASDLVPVDTTSGAVTITLPTAPADKSVVAVKHVIQGSTNTVSLATGGSDVFNKAGGGTTGTLTLLNQGILLQYKSSSAIWYAIADDIPLSGMDARYVNVSGALGTPSSGTLTNATGLPISTGVSGLGTGVATFLATPSFSNFNAMTTGDDAAGLATANAFTAAQSITLSNAQSQTNTITGLGTTTLPGLQVTNTTAAAAGAQQYSPSVRWTGQGWKTTATAASQAVDFRAYVVPVQGTANPTAYLLIESAINGGAFGNGFKFYSNGNIGLGTASTPGGAAGQIQTTSSISADSGITANGSDVDANNLKAHVGGLVTFSNGSNYTNTGIARQADGVLEVNAGSAGSSGVLLVRGRTISNLPASPVAGMQATVTDGDASLAWGATVLNSGAGATKYLVWYNGSNWTVVGK